MQKLLHDGRRDTWDRNFDTIEDAWDRDHDGTPEEFDTDGDHIIDAWDIDGDGWPDTRDTDGDGTPDAPMFDTTDNSIPYDIPSIQTAGGSTVDSSQTDDS
jgi:hypothetical protein